MARICFLCGEKPAAVPDRECMGRPIKRVCRDCHQARLRGDLKKILAARAKRTTDSLNTPSPEPACSAERSPAQDR